MRIKIKQYSTVILGVFLVALAFNVFLAPYDFVAGGISGLSLIARKLFFIKTSTFIFVGNIFLLLISLRFLGKEKTKNTVLGALLLPIFIGLTENIQQFIVLDSLDPLIIALLGGCISGVGYGLVFQNNFTTGGTDILNQMMEKYLKIPMAKSIMYVDGPIVVLGCVTFGFINMLYSLIVLYLVSTLSNNTMLQLNKNRLLYIQTSKIKEVKEYLIEIFHYDVTLLNSIGGFQKEKAKIIMCSVDNKHYYQIKEGISLIDPGAFITVTKSYEQKNANKTLRKAQS